MRAFGYVRVSKGDSDALSLGAQEGIIRKAVDEKGWLLVDVVSEQFSARKVKNRPKFLELLDRLDRGEADALVVSRLDRAWRSLGDFARTLERAQENGWTLVMLSPAVDMTDMYGRAMAGSAAVWAQLERELTSQRTSEALQALKAQGVRLGRPSSLTEQTRARVIALALENGYAPTARILNAEKVPTAHGGTQWWPSSVRSVVMAG